MVLPLSAYISQPLTTVHLLARPNTGMLIRAIVAQRSNTEFHPLFLCHILSAAPPDHAPSVRYSENAPDGLPESFPVLPGGQSTPLSGCM